MKKWYSYLMALPLLALFSFQCSKETEGAEFTGRVELEGICGRVVVSVTSGDLSALPANSYADTWRDPSTGINYQKVFMIANICQVQTELKKGDLLRFRVHPQPDLACITCLAYSPAPEQMLPIEVLSRTPGR